jgi:uncharacterized membrane protein AbrB (regulator of aidB expression)
MNRTALRALIALVFCALSCVSAVVVTILSAAVWRYMFGWPLAMSVLSSVPGSSSFIISVSMDMGADAARIAVVQQAFEIARQHPVGRRV